EALPARGCEGSRLRGRRRERHARAFRRRSHQGGVRSDAARQDRSVRRPPAQAEVTSVRFVAFAALAVAASAAAQTRIDGDNPLPTGSDQQAAAHINDAIYLAYGFGNTFLVTTSAGNVVIDTSSVVRAPRAKELLQRENAGPIKYIILTHGHGDHTGGVPL